MRKAVIDSSVTLGFILRDEQSAFAIRVFDALENVAEIYVPSLWWIETANGLLMAERRKRISQNETFEALQTIQKLSVQTDMDGASQAVLETVALARQYRLTVYDAAYLELTLRMKATLATADRALINAAKEAGVSVLV